MLIKIETLTPSEVLNLISTLDVGLASRLSETLDLTEYSIKLAKHAHFIVYYIGSVRCGVIAFYENREHREIYVPYLCTSSMCRRLGIAKFLMANLVCYADSLMYKIRLEVLKINTPAIILYKSNGFEICAESDSKLSMIRRCKE